jgi:hypothetical protein
MVCRAIVRRERYEMAVFRSGAASCAPSTPLRTSELRAAGTPGKWNGPVASDEWLVARDAGVAPRSVEMGGETRNPLISQTLLISRAPLAVASGALSGVDTGSPDLKKCVTSRGSPSFVFNKIALKLLCMVCRLIWRLKGGFEDPKLDRARTSSWELWHLFCAPPTIRWRWLACGW